MNPQEDKADQPSAAREGPPPSTITLPDCRSDRIEVLRSHLSREQEAAMGEGPPPRITITLPGYQSDRIEALKSHLAHEQGVAEEYDFYGGFLETLFGLIPGSGLWTPPSEQRAVELAYALERARASRPWQGTPQEAGAEEARKVFDACGDVRALASGDWAVDHVYFLLERWGEARARWLAGSQPQPAWEELEAPLRELVERYTPELRDAYSGSGTSAHADLYILFTLIWEWRRAEDEFNDSDTQHNHQRPQSVESYYAFKRARAWVAFKRDSLGRLAKQARLPRLERSRQLRYEGTQYTAGHPLKSQNDADT